MVRVLLFVFVVAFFCQANAQVKPIDKKLVAAMKDEALQHVQGNAKKVQEMVDMVFSFGELGFQETETSAYLTKILSENGFTIERGVSGIPTAWFARWGSGSPVIALGSDVDCIPKASQKPGVAYRDPIVDGAPGHGDLAGCSGGIGGQQGLVYQGWIFQECGCLHLHACEQRICCALR
jgi:aminobenzoyl-glutamate utilization protein B